MYSFTDPMWFSDVLVIMLTYDNNYIRHDIFTSEAVRLGKLSGAG